MSNINLPTNATPDDIQKAIRALEDHIDELKDDLKKAKDMIIYLKVLMDIQCKNLSNDELILGCGSPTYQTELLSWDKEDEIREDEPIKKKKNSKKKSQV
jgi:hypothetical protein